RCIRDTAHNASGQLRVPCRVPPGWRFRSAIRGGSVRHEPAAGRPAGELDSELFRGFAVREGGLISYGVDPVELFRRAAGYVDRVLKGAKAAELPMQAPVKFDLLINLKTANALALSILLLATADEIIE